MHHARHCGAKTLLNDAKVCMPQSTFIYHCKRQDSLHVVEGATSQHHVNPGADADTTPR
jgi:hypothetical protein